MATLLVLMGIVGAGSDLVYLEIGPLDVGCVVVDRSATQQTLDSTAERDER